MTTEEKLEKIMLDKGGLIAIVNKPLMEVMKEVYNTAIDDASNRAYEYYIEKSGEVVGPDYKEELQLLKIK